jgi:hypothetical protein
MGREESARLSLTGQESSSGFSASRVYFNILGGSLTLLSVQLPWMTINGTYPITLQSGGVWEVVFFWVLAGAILSFLSRLGGFMTLVGMIPFFSGPYISYSLVSPGLGLLIAFTGAIFTFVGVGWSIPGGILKGREILGGILYSVGFLTILSLVVSSTLYGGAFSMDALFVSMPLLIVAVLMTGLGLKLFLKEERSAASLSREGVA